ncbi:hypothetical protein FQN57_001661 [Myotisia sp. PD_48]|nr:hypothetical protein FQN57_001661 [Myotisia sp. PD_48]
MKFSVVPALSLFFSVSSAAAVANQVTLSYDPRYDNAAMSLRDVSCSDGINGLIRKGYTTAGSIPNFPHLGGAFAVEGWNSKNCGKCFKVTWRENNKSIFITAIDRATGFNIAKRAMDDLTGGMANELGRINVDYEEAKLSDCKMK